MLVALLTLTACSKGGPRADLLSRVPADRDVAVVGDLGVIVESLGGTVDGSEITVPDYLLTAMMSDDDKQLVRFIRSLSQSGINLEDIAVAFKYNDYSSVAVMKVDDESLLYSFSKANNFAELPTQKGVRFYKIDRISGSDVPARIAMGLKDDYVYLAIDKNSEKSGTQLISSFIAAANASALSKTDLKDYLLEGNAASGVMRWSYDMKQTWRTLGVPKEMSDLCNGYICFDLTLEGQKASGSLRLLDQKGKKVDSKIFSKFIDMDGRISTGAMKYINHDETYVYAMAMKKFNWDLLTGAATRKLNGPQAFMAGTIIGYLKKIDGTVAVGLNVGSGNLNDISELQKSLGFTAVLELKKGKTAFKDIKSLIQSIGVPFSESGNNAISISMKPLIDGDLNILYDGDYLVVSSRAINKSGDNPVVKSNDFGRYLMAYGAQMGNGSSVPGFTVPFDCDMFWGFDGADVRVDYKISLNGGQGRGFLEKFARASIEQMQMRQKQMPASAIVDQEPDSDDDFYDIDDEEMLEIE